MDQNLQHVNLWRTFNIQIITASDRTGTDSLLIARWTFSAPHLPLPPWQEEWFSYISYKHIHTHTIWGHIELANCDLGEVSEGSNLADTLIFDFQPPEFRKINSFCLKKFLVLERGSSWHRKMSYLKRCIVYKNYSQVWPHTNCLASQNPSSFICQTGPYLNQGP